MLLVCCDGVLPVLKFGIELLLEDGMLLVLVGCVWVGELAGVGLNVI